MAESTLSYIRQNAVIAHSASHENGGGDEINVAALSGELADPQPPKAHVADHQNGGGDEVNVADLSGELADGQKVKLNYVDKTHLSADFGASATRLRNIIMRPVSGNMIKFLPAKSPSVFSGLINVTVTATSLVYDGDTNEGMLEGIQAGASYWGRIILHNTTRGTSRKIVSCNVATNTITTESSVDSWADNDVITCQSQTNAQSGYFDVDVSSEIATTTVSAIVFVTLDDNEGNYDASRYVVLHPYEAYDAGKRQYLHSRISNQANSLTFPMDIVSQTITMMLAAGVVDVNFVVSVSGIIEYADT